MDPEETEPLVTRQYLEEKLSVAYGALRNVLLLAVQADLTLREIDILRAAERIPPPVKMEITCPKCLKQHVDQEEWATTRVHKNHLCEHCGNLWRPFPFATIGVESVRKG